MRDIPIKVFRIDDRLVHGQVTVGWTRAYDIRSIVVANDVLAKDEIQLMVLTMAAPAGINVTAMTISDFAAAYHQGRFEQVQLMVIVTNPTDVVRLLDAGVRLTSVNVGGMQYKRGKTQISKAVSVNEEDIRSFHELAQRGVELEVRMFPSDPKEDLMVLLSK